MQVESKSRSDLAGTVTAVVFILMACLALWDTTSMTDSDSYVFPRAIAAAMIVFCILLIAYNFIKRPADEAAGGTGSASTPRRVGLVAAMLGASLVMPWVGFLLSGFCAFGAIMLFAMYDPWTGRRRIVFPVAGLAIVLGFYTLFSKVLLVPLPVGVWFR
ncbi:tripartite tricarboxylate transporter TctB family protein [Pelagibius sp. Alg239-R121]|uniref:tripartite tricarboxylate transporter TctB family protein n=1 Tax=Pelagibius sp. Alg239-R121 TaxID=2993448 RepID=UPI0024A706DD|nr:tripartite tricarboxylate transporter TctB family protein [Pelagibius sp. Alg239-R121]